MRGRKLLERLPGICASTPTLLRPHPARPRAQRPTSNTFTVVLYIARPVFRGWHSSQASSISPPPLPLLLKHACHHRVRHRHHVLAPCSVLYIQASCCQAHKPPCCASRAMARAHAHIHALPRAQQCQRVAHREGFQAFLHVATLAHPPYQPLLSPYHALLASQQRDPRTATQLCAHVSPACEPNHASRDAAFTSLGSTNSKWKILLPLPAHQRLASRAARSLRAENDAVRRVCVQHADLHTRGVPHTSPCAKPAAVRPRVASYWIACTPSAMTAHFCVTPRTRNAAELDLDDVFAYTTPRTVRVRDRYLGLTKYTVMIGVFSYVIAYQLLAKQSYSAFGTIAGSVRLQLKEPSSIFRYPDGEAPYCLGGNASGSPLYSFPQPGMYKYNGPGGVVAPQGVCQYLDARFAVNQPVEVGAVFIPSRISVSQQSAIPSSACATLGHSYCTWNTTVPDTLNYVADVDMFTLFVRSPRARAYPACLHRVRVPTLTVVRSYCARALVRTMQIDHAFTASNGVARSAYEMSGELLDSNGEPMDPCIAYTLKQLPCPYYVNVGKQDAKDIVPLRALMLAAGIDNLDTQTSNMTGLNDTRRYDGVVIIINIYYTNYYLKQAYAPGTGVRVQCLHAASFTLCAARCTCTRRARPRCLSMLVCRP
ncbi:hypothetical protein EON66_02585 [archaeon]|nr:MAG: hypothetical protein EON66_02585 [archaeon]